MFILTLSNGNNNNNNDDDNNNNNNNNNNCNLDLFLNEIASNVFKGVLL